MFGAVVVTYGCKYTNGKTLIHTQKLFKSVASSDDPCVPIARFAMLLYTEQGCNSVLCLRAAVNATKLIRLPPGGRDDSLMTLADTDLYTQ